MNERLFTPLSRVLTDLDRPTKQLLMMLVDVASLSFTVWAAYSFRLGQWFVPNWQQTALMVVAPLVAIPLFVTLGLYRSVIRYVGEKAIWAVVRGMTVATLVWTGMSFFLGMTGLAGVPRSIPILYWLFGMFAVGGSRFLARWILWQPLRRRYRGHQVLIYGAGTAGRQLAISLRKGSELFPAGFIDDDARLHGRDVDGLRVYSPAQTASIIEHFEIKDLIVTESALPIGRRGEVMLALQRLPVHVRILPAISEIASGRYLVQMLREMDINDLLGREQVTPTPNLTAHDIAGRTVLVTGAGGSIGSELCRQLLRARPARLLLVDNGEYNLYSVHSELQKIVAVDGENKRAATELVPLITSVCDYGRMSEIFHVWQPHTVYHAAAYKHVPLVECNPAEGVRNNVFGTLAVARAALEHGVDNFVLVSTDKAVRPTNVMGASKRLAEMVLQALAGSSRPVFDGAASVEEAENRTCFSMVRFGNVLGSSGSVVPLFRQQIRGGGPITLTDAEVTRYFMTIPEAAQLVIHAGAMAEGGEVFVLDMGEPVKIIDLARRMVEMSGLTVRDGDNPDGDIEIVITGLRPGEKLYEELLIGNNPKPTVHPRIMKAHEACTSWENLRPKLRTLRVAADNNDVAVIRKMLEALVNGYDPHAEIVDLVSVARSGPSGR